MDKLKRTRLILISILIMTPWISRAQFVEMQFNLTGAHYRDANRIDYDNDGDLDIVLNGLLYRNDGNYAQTVTDAVGNTYNTVTIGNQVWMKENLKTTKFNDGTPIPEVTDNNGWSAANTPAYCWYNNDSNTYKAIYGALYNWQTMNSGKLCPTGWHVPSNEEWHVLENFLGNSVAGGKIKSTTNDWRTPNVGATNESGFTALPAGYRGSVGSYFCPIGAGAYLGSLTEFTASEAYCIEVHSNVQEIYFMNVSKGNGNSIRCIKDNSGTSIGKMPNTEIKVYPNPATNYLYFENLSSNTTANIYCLTGRLINRVNIEGGYIDISHLQPGIYIIEIQDNGSFEKIKFVKN
ncbi:FISUMP domain-containing protein [Saccharicrinis sp. FJH2]|uniref:FISUMP domain-containing protein n=1 Tax=Saccharicrinis sp. FJH65 TaxID=3344659 RepID=UPI0035F33F75